MNELTNEEKLLLIKQFVEQTSDQTDNIRKSVRSGLAKVDTSFFYTAIKGLYDDSFDDFYKLKEIINSDDISQIIFDGKNYTGFFNQAVSKVVISGTEDIPILFKIRKSTEKTAFEIDLENRLYMSFSNPLENISSGLNLEVPSRINQMICSSLNGESYFVTADKLLSGVDLDEVDKNSLEGNEYTSLIISVAITIHDIQKRISSVLTEQDVANLRDRFDDGSHFDYAGKIVDHFARYVGMNLNSSLFGFLNDYLNDPAFESNKIATFDANPTNFKIDFNSSKPIRLYDFNVIRFNHRQDDWVRNLDHPNYLPVELREKLVDLAFIWKEKESSENVLSDDDYRSLFHGMAVYRNLCLSTQRFSQGRLIDALMLADRATLSLGHMNPGSDLEKNLSPYFIELTNKVADQLGVQFD